MNTVFRYKERYLFPTYTALCYNAPEEFKNSGFWVILGNKKFKMEHEILPNKNSVLGGFIFFPITAEFDILCSHNQKAIYSINFNREKGKEERETSQLSLHSPKATKARTAAGLGE